MSQTFSSNSQDASKVSPPADSSAAPVPGSGPAAASINTTTTALPAATAAAALPTPTPTPTTSAPPSAAPSSTAASDSRRISMASIASSIYTNASSISSTSSLSQNLEHHLSYPPSMPQAFANNIISSSTSTTSVASSSTLIEPSHSNNSISALHFTPSSYASPKYSDDETTHLNSKPSIAQHQPPPPPQVISFQTPVSSPPSRASSSPASLEDHHSITPPARLTPTPSSNRHSIPNQKPIQYQYPSPVLFSRTSTPSPPTPQSSRLKLNKRALSHHNHFRNNQQAFKSRRHINHKKKGSLTFSSKSASPSPPPPQPSQNFNQHDVTNNNNMMTPEDSNTPPNALLLQTTAPEPCSLSSTLTSVSSASPQPQEVLPPQQQRQQQAAPPPPSLATPIFYDVNNIPADLLPPVNINSLREIELQEIIKNPQLRHDIVFDPQLQFRPNLDGERGKRKKATTEYYWNSVVAECESLAMAANPAEVAVILDNTHCKLPYLFVTLRDILNSLLPVQDHQTIEEVLDLELLMQQLRACTLDFSALANWLAGIFKAHCAPMRDYWVDQMVTRVEQGVENRSPRRIVEGLRMMFAILEAMKLDVANHQIRTLRSVMVESAIDFEQDYYSQMVEKNKFDLQDSMQWYSNNLTRYMDKIAAAAAAAAATSGAAVVGRRTPEACRSAFVYGTAMLMSCASDEVVTEFPSTFGFDFARLAGFRAEVRQIVCLHLSVSLFRELLTSQLNKKQNLTNMMRRKLFNAATTVGEMEKMKEQVLAIVGDAYGNAKWTKNTSILALEISRKVEIACLDTDDQEAAAAAAAAAASSVVPCEDVIDMASNWLFKHLQPKSMLYKLVETKVINALIEVSSKSMNTFSALDQPPSLANPDLFVIRPSGAMPQSAGSPASLAPEICGRREILEMASKVLVLLHFHWGVFSKFYVHYASLGDNDDMTSQYSSSSLSEDSNSSVPRTKRSNANAAAVLGSKEGGAADNEITQSL